MRPQDTLAVLSVQHQTVHVFRITADGQFADVRSIGRFCYDDDELVVGADGAAATPGGGASGPIPRPQRHFREATINALKHRLLVFLYRRAVALSELSFP